MDVDRTVATQAIVLLMKERLDQRRRAVAQRRRRQRWLAILLRCRRERVSQTYCRLNRTVPVLARYFAGEDTKPDFRLSREAILHLLDALGSERRHGWGATLETLVFLFWLASGSAYRIVSRAFQMPLSTVHRVVHRMADEVVGVLPKFIYLPSGEEQLREVGEGFARLAGHQAFSMVAGAIDGSHIRIKCPAGPDSQDYKNRKLFPSIVMQAVADHQGRFLDIFVGFPGSVHDARILRNSPIYTMGAYPPPGYFLLGDGGYPCLQEPLALITPYKRPVRGMAEQRFNNHHSKARCIIERAFGMMKTRFRCIFLDALEVQVQFISKVVACCAILHNICIGVGDELHEVLQQEEDVGGLEAPADAVSGAALRAVLTNWVSALQQPPLDHDYAQF